VIFKDIKDGIKAYIYDPMMYEKASKTYEYNGVIAFQYAYADAIASKKLTIEDLSKYCFITPDENKEKRCIQYYFDAQACHIYSLYFIFMFVAKMKKTKKTSNLMCFFHKPDEPYTLKIQWDNQVQNCQIVPTIENAKKSRDHTNITSLKFRIVMVYFCANLHKVIWSSVIESCFYQKYFGVHLKPLFIVWDHLENLIQKR
jgi:hypothetical protein